MRRPPPVASKNECGRFAPSTTGPSHPGTLLAALLCWLDVRSLGGQFCVRFEDLDAERCRPEYQESLRADLEWLGLDWDSEVQQSHRTPAHHAALDFLAERDLLYPCRCTRSELRAMAERAPDGSFRYPGTCRARRLPSPVDGGWRACSDSLRVRLPDIPIELQDESGRDLSQNPARSYGDPVVGRRDGAVAYHLASVVDDQAAGVTRVVRGHDLAASSAVQSLLGQLLGLPQPRYHHHLLLLEKRGRKLAKFHQSVGTHILKQRYDAPLLCGLLAQACELIPEPVAIRPRELLETFTWSAVRDRDRVMVWDGECLQAGE